MQITTPSFAESLAHSHSPAEPAPDAKCAPKSEAGPQDSVTVQAGKPERDVVTAFLALSRYETGPAAKTARKALQKLWISGDFRNAEVRAAFAKIKAQSSGHPRVARLAQDALANLEKSSRPNLAEYNDNRYGRYFESEISRRLVNEPTPEMLTAAKTQMAFLKRQVDDALNGMDKSERKAFLAHFKQALKADKRPWQGRVSGFPSDAQMLDRKALDALFSPPERGLDIVKTQYLAVQTSLALRAAAKRPTWLAKADLLYPSIEAARSGRPRAPQSLTTRPGIGLAHHDDTPEFGGFRTGKSWADNREPNYSLLASLHENGTPHFEYQAITSGHPIVNGLSGSANILTHLAQDVKAQHSDFSEGAAALNASTFLTFDGGHSLTESMAVHKAITAPPPKPQSATSSDYESSSDSDSNSSFDSDSDSDDEDHVPRNTRAILLQRQADLAQYRLNYAELPQLLAPGPGHKQVQQTLNAALNDTVQHFITTRLDTSV